MYSLLFFLALFFLWGLKKLLLQEGFFVPLPMGTIKKMISLAEIKKGDIIYDLGSGDGRVLFESIKTNEVKAIGIENVVPVFLLSRIRQQFSENKNKVNFLFKDFFKVNLKDADVIFIYLTPKLNEKLKEKFKKDLKKGTRIISASHEIKGWKSSKKIKTGHFWTYLYRI